MFVDDQIAPLLKIPERYNSPPKEKMDDVEKMTKVIFSLSFLFHLNLIPLLLHVWGLWFIGPKNGGKSLQGINPSCDFFSKLKIFKGGPDRGRSRTFSLAKGP